jgi:[acyl-carrier-protein] S-malonyltransferase
MMASAAAEFGVAVAATPITAPTVPLIGTVTGRPLATPEAIRTELKAQLTSAVAWTESMTYLLAQGVDTFVEVGSGDVLLSLIKRIDRQANRVKFEIGG